MTFQYPNAKVDNTIKDTYHGVEVSDPFRWLEDPYSEETNQFINAENAVTRPYIDSYPLKENIKKKLTDLWNYPKLSPPFKHGNKYFQFRNTGLQNQSVLYVQDSLNSESKVFLDPNLLSEDGTIALPYSKFSRNGDTFAYGLSSKGSDWLEIKFRNTHTGEDFKEVLKKVKYSSMSWTYDNTGFFYCAYLEQQGKSDGSETDSTGHQKLYYHKLGTDQSNDVVVVQFEDPRLYIRGEVSNCGNYLIITPSKGTKNNSLYFTKLDTKKEITGLLKLYPVVTEFESDFNYVANIGTKVIFRTDKDAPNYKLVVINFDNLDEKWVDLIPEHPKDLLDWAEPVNNNQLVVCYLHNVKHIMSLHKLDTGGKIQDFALDLGAVLEFSGRHDSPEIFYKFNSFLIPNIIYRVDLSKPPIQTTILHETKLPNFDPKEYKCSQVFYPSKDGTLIPMFLVKKRQRILNDTMPCLLYGYGGFSVTLKASFKADRLMFIDYFNGIYAIANIRGGGEYGETWHQGGSFKNKQNSLDDFQHAAKYLIENKYTSNKKLAIIGGSNGGLLVGACINQAPELFGAAICMVGVLDMLRYHKFTVGYAWASEYGTSDTPEEFKYLYKYSPLHNIKEPPGDGQYPATLVVTADHDDRVVPLHSLKFIAELQRQVGNLPKQTNPLMIRVDTKAGHGAGKPTAKLIDEYTDVFSFMAKSLNLKFH